MKIVGIISNFIEDDTYTKLHTSYYQVRELYVRALQKYLKDGIIIIIPYIKNKINKYIKMCDGVLLVGGDDINPNFYGEEILFNNVSKSKIRYNFELEFIKRYIKTNKPLLGICAGMQAINVALSGSLYQDINKQLKESITHNQSEKFSTPIHEVKINNGTLLHKIIKKNIILTNSIHHQCIKKLGKNLIISATSNDGIIEGIELKNHKFLIGLQWHPEFNSNKYDKIIFESFCQSL